MSHEAKRQALLLHQHAPHLVDFHGGSFYDEGRKFTRLVWLHHQMLTRAAALAPTAD
jgi:hypothetical protein